MPVALFVEDALDDLAATGLMDIRAVVVGGEEIVEDEVSKAFYDEHLRRMFVCPYAVEYVFHVQGLVFALFEEAEQAVQQFALAQAAGFP